MTDRTMESKPGSKFPKKIFPYFFSKKFWRSSKKLKILHFFVLEAREERKYELS